MKTITLAVTLLVVTSSLRADVPALDESTMNAFNTVCAALAEQPLVKGSFEQEKKLNRLDRSLKSSGNFIIAAGRGMVWDTLKPFPSTLVLGKNYLIQTRSGGQKNVISAQGNETFIRMAEVLNAVFSGQSQELLHNFEVFFANNAEGWEMGLIPRDKAIAAFAAKLRMSGDSAIRLIAINEQNGDTITYLLSNHQYPGALSADEENHFTVP